jgi:hypothetical protein
MFLVRHRIALLYPLLREARIGRSLAVGLVANLLDSVVGQLRRQWSPPAVDHRQDPSHWRIVGLSRPRQVWSGGGAETMVSQRSSVVL